MTTDTLPQRRRQTRPIPRRPFIRWIMKEYASIFGFIIGVWLTRHSLHGMALVKDLQHHDVEERDHPVKQIRNVRPLPPLSQSSRRQTTVVDAA